ncbi:MAG: GNAT family N-acetyltransferase, partial [Sphingobacteriales bacterium]
MPHSSTYHIGLQYADKHELELAVAENHRQLYALNTLVIGGEVFHGEGISWTNAGPRYPGIVMFPELNHENAGAEIDRIMDHYRSHPPMDAGYWSLDPAQPADISVKLLARGWQTGWQSCWMAKDGAASNINEERIEGIDIIADNSRVIDAVPGLPYSADSAYSSLQLLIQHPERAQRFLALQNGNIIGQCLLFFSTGPYGIAGMYNVGVIPQARRKGIGNAIVIAACNFAHEKGYRFVMLNANSDGRPVYEKAGFTVTGYGSTWWLMGKNYITHKPSKEQIGLAEAIGTGNLNALDQLLREHRLADLHSPMTNKMSWVQLAVQFQQKEAAEWLLAQGAPWTALDAWDLGWKDRAAALLADNREEIRRRYFEWGGTLPHIAA